MFESTIINPPDAIFGLNEEFNRDPNPDRINLTVGMYQDESGRTPIMDCVRQAGQRLMFEATGHVYLPIDGIPAYNLEIPRLIFGGDHPAVSANRVLSAQTPGGTGALRISAELLHRVYGVRRIWIPVPTWTNHLDIFPDGGLSVEAFNFLDESATKIDFDKFTAAMQSMQSGDAILLHCVCHNPTGLDLSSDQWKQVFEAIEQRRLIPIFDFAYQGFAESVDADASPIREFCRSEREALICSSFSKNFNLYGERIGAITVVTQSSETALAALSQIKSTIRTIYSNPPMHGGAIVTTVLTDSNLRAHWLVELEAMRRRLIELRQLFVSTISQRIRGANFDHILRQRGMFSYSGISGEAADRLKSEHSIYLLRSGRINIAGINTGNVERLCDAIAKVIA